MQREIAYDPVFDAQGHYRLLLDAMARPGKINVLPRMQLAAPAGLTDAGALVGFGLLNADVSFFVDGAQAYVATQYLVVNTSARPATLEEADFVFSMGTASAVLPEGMKKGSLSYPDEGATLIAGVDVLTSSDDGLEEGLAITLQGPGIAGRKTFFVRGLNATLVEAVQQANMEFPLGIDLILTDVNGRIACIPRSSRIGWEVL